MNAETDVRGYAATGDPLFLVPYNLMPPLAADRSIKISQDRPWADPAPRTVPAP